MKQALSLSWPARRAVGHRRPPALALRSWKREGAATPAMRSAAAAPPRATVTAVVPDLNVSQRPLYRERAAAPAP